MPDLRLATPTDAAAIAAIYAPIVQDTGISFELTPPSEAEMRARVVKTLGQYPWLVCEDAGEVLGYAYASPHRSRAAYQWSAEVSVYVAAAARRRGVGRALYTALFATLKIQGYVNAYAGIALPNAASVAIHEGFGFTPIGVYRQVGYKQGAWRDVGWWHLPLQTAPANPSSPVPFGEVAFTEPFQQALQDAAAFLKGSG